MTRVALFLSTICCFAFSNMAIGRANVGENQATINIVTNDNN
jgi:hypothetical protein